MFNSLPFSRGDVIDSDLYSYLVFHLKHFRFSLPAALLSERIQFSSPSGFRGGPGIYNKTSFASWDLLTITSLSFTAVCIRLTLDWSLEREGEGLETEVGYGKEKTKAYCQL